MKRVLILALLVLLTLPLSAQQYKKTSAEITVAGTAIALFSATDVNGNGHPAATMGVCSLTGANIRISFDGVDPTTSLGEVLVPGNYVVNGTDTMLNMKGIRDDSTSATWNCIVLLP